MYENRAIYLNFCREVYVIFIFRSLPNLHEKQQQQQQRCKNLEFSKLIINHLNQRIQPGHKQNCLHKQKKSNEFIFILHLKLKAKNLRKKEKYVKMTHQTPSLLVHRSLLHFCWRQQLLWHWWKPNKMPI